MKQYRYFDLIMTAFVTVLVVSNLASSAKIVDWGVNLFGVLGGPTRLWSTPNDGRPNDASGDLARAGEGSV